ncbi:hypothetical protein CSPX01_06493 [Colletotrichum filicis]|nr:hypothetical protein CSPX01_06493 [Colletotrichum filicis]
MSRVLSLVSGAYMPAVVSWRGVLSTHFLWCYWLASSRTKMRQPPLRSTYILWCHRATLYHNPWLPEAIQG